MRTLPALFLILISTIATSSAQPANSINSVRKDLFYSDFNLNKCYQFYKSIIDLKEQNSLVKAYQAAAEALIAKHSWNPVTKVSYLNSAQELLTEAVADDDTNLEIRFLRLYIENSIPAYLGMSKNVKQDKQVIIENIEKLPRLGLDTNITDYIIKYITSSKISSTEEIVLIRQKLAVK